MNVWIRGRSESLIAPQAASMSALWVRARPQITGPSTLRAIASTASKSPGEVIGKPASITSTPSRASCWAISTFSWVLSEIPGDCSPSRSVVSKMWTLFGRLAGAHVALLLSTWSNDLVSRGCRAAQRYSPRRGRRRRSARLSSRWVIRLGSTQGSAPVAANPERAGGTRWTSSASRPRRDQGGGDRRSSRSASPCCSTT